MTATMLDRPVMPKQEPKPKSKGRPQKQGGEGSLVRIDSDIVNMGRYLSARLGLPMSEMFSTILRPEIESQFRKVTREVLEAQGKASEDARVGAASESDDATKARKKKGR